MKKIVSLTFFDLEFDNRVKKTVHAVGEDWMKFVIYNSHIQSFAYTKQSRLRYINLNVGVRNNLYRFIRIQIGFLRQLLKLKPQLIWCNDIQPAPAVLLYKFFFRKTNIIYDAHEMEVTLYPKHQKVVKWLENKICAKADGILTINDTIADFMHEEYGKKPFIIKNFPSVSDNFNSKEEFLKRYNLASTHKLILYTGALLPNERGIEEVIQALAKLPEHYLFLISAVGDLVHFNNYVQKCCEAANIDQSRVRFIGPFEEAELIDVVSFCDVSILLYNYRLNRNNDINTPNKLYQALVAGTHMLMCDNTSFKSLVASMEISIGELVPPDNIQKISEGIVSIIERPSFFNERQKIKEFGKRFTWESEMDKLTGIIKGVISEN